MELGKYLKVCKFSNVSIGARNGCAFMYIGDKNATETIDILFDEYHSRMYHKYPKLLGEYRLFLENHEFDLKTEDGLLAYGKKVASLWNSCDKCKLYLETYKPVLERKIVDHYIKESEPDTEVIIIEGMERGQYWTYDEYLKDQLKKLDIPVSDDVRRLIREAEKDGRNYVFEKDFFNEIFAKYLGVPKKDHTTVTCVYSKENLNKEYGLEAADVISR